MVGELFTQGDRDCWRGTRGVDFDEFILYNVNMVNVTFLPKLEGKRTFEFELALKTRSDEVEAFSMSLSEQSLNHFVKGDEEAEFGLWRGTR